MVDGGCGGNEIISDPYENDTMASLRYAMPLRLNEVVSDGQILEQITIASNGKNRIAVAPDVSGPSPHNAGRISQVLANQLEHPALPGCLASNCSHCCPGSRLHAYLNDLEHGVCVFVRTGNFPVLHRMLCCTKLCT
jgi:hypothetical protein